MSIDDKLIRREAHDEYLDIIANNIAPHFTCGDYRSGDEAPKFLRTRLAERLGPAWSSVDLVPIRKACHSATGKTSEARGTRRNGEPAKPPREKLTAMARRNADNRDTSHLSPEYLTYIDGQVWKSRARQHKREVDYLCQLCGQHFQGSELEVHHVKYGPFDGSEHWSTLLCVCSSACHPIADLMRQGNAESLAAISMITYGSLFSGIGGVDLGFDRAGMECQWQVEYDDYATMVLEKHWPAVERFRDVREFKPSKRHRVDVISGGFPCQDISNAANNRKGVDGERSGLWGEMLRIIKRISPAVVFIENVSVLRSRGLGRVLRQLSELGYDSEWATLRASDFGFAHQRARLFLIAYTNRVNGNNRIHHERFDALGTRSEFNASSRSCQDAGDFQRRLVATYRAFGFSPHDPATRGRVNGIPNRVDRLRGLGNAVVPHIAEVIGRRIVTILENQGCEK